MRLLLLLILSFFTLQVAAQETVYYDSSDVAERGFSSASMDKFKKDPAFQYDRIKEPPVSLWDRFWSWFWYEVNQLLSTPGGRTTFWSLSILLGIVAIVFVVLKVMKMNRAGLFGRSVVGGLAYETETEDIHSIPFANAIEQAVKQHNYRLAVRLLYLQTLKELTDRALINWQINKTNYEYLRELHQHPHQAMFKDLTYHFEYVWYGDMPVDQEQFSTIQQLFTQFNNKL
jgi:hypothetical protein